MARWGNENAAAGRHKDTASRDREYGGGMSQGGGGGSNDRSASVIGHRFGAPSASAVAAAKVRNAPQGGLLAGMNPQHYSRRTPNQTPSYEMSLHNMFELGKFATSLMGGGLGTMAALGKLAAGYGPEFEGYTGEVMGPGDWDPKNIAGTGQGLMSRMNARAGRGLQRGY